MSIIKLIMKIMKQVLILIISLLCTISGFAQNPGSAYWQEKCNVPSIKYHSIMGSSFWTSKWGLSGGGFGWEEGSFDTWYVDTVAMNAYLGKALDEVRMAEVFVLPDSIDLRVARKNQTDDQTMKRYRVKGLYDWGGGTRASQPDLSSFPEFEIGNGAFSVTLYVTSIILGDDAILHNGAFSGSSLLSFAIPSKTSAIPLNCFLKCKRLKSVQLHKDVKAIGYRAFYGCDSLTAVSGLTSGSIFYIGAEAFRECLGFTSFVVPENIDTIWSGTFSGCRSLETVTISEKTRCIKDNAFLNCTGLKSIHIPAMVSFIDTTAFYGCDPSSIVVDAGNATYDSRDNCNAIIRTASKVLIKGCSSTIVPGDIRRVVSEAFAGSKIRKVTLPESTESVGDYAFANCVDLESVEILSGKCVLGKEVFRGCTGLRSIRVSWSRPPFISRDIFKGMSLPQCTLYVPKGTAAMYMSAPVWIEFGNIIEVEGPSDICYLTLRQGEGGVAKQTIGTGQCYGFTFIPDAGWRIHTVSFNGEDVTSQLSDGQYSTPVITGDSELSVVYVKDTEDIGQTVGESSVRVLVHGQSLSVSGVKDGSVVSVYDTQGKLQRTVRGNATLTLPSGIYVVKAEGQTFKAAL